MKKNIRTFVLILLIFVLYSCGNNIVENKKTNIGNDFIETPSVNNVEIPGAE